MSTCTVLDIEKLERPNPPFICASEQTDAKKRLTLSRGELVEMITRELEDRVTTLLVCPNAQIFRQERSKIFGEYSLLLKTVSKIILTDTDAMVHQGLVQGCISNYERRVQAHSNEIFGQDVTGEILFCLATMRRTYKLVGQILSRLEIPQVSVDEDLNNVKEFSAAVSWTGIHLDCIFYALHDGGKSLPLDVLQEILKGCRLAVTAYAHARAGYDLRYKAEATQQEQTQWDEEDRYLAAISTEEVATIRE